MWCAARGDESTFALHAAWRRSFGAIRRDRRARFIRAIPNDTRYAPGSDLLGDWRGQCTGRSTATTPPIGATTAGIRQRTACASP
jgi:hypothetical protein